ncbi:MAG TPA: RES family NAD+ phosphorylase [Burkholderiaceae bacterium]|nr:RES family NAD+ phosphorylase [Burkholderiaceae bacterium]
MISELVDTNADFHGDLVRNIRGIRRSQNLFDDLSSDPADWEVAIAAEGQERIPTEAAFITRPFDYGTVITYSFETAHWHETRFSDGRLFGVWYGAFDIKTTVFETAFHWHRFVLDSFAGEDREIRTERRVFDVRCDALLLDLRGKRAAYPELVNRKSYAFCHQLGRYVHEQQLNGLLVQSARHDEGTNAAIFKPDRLSNVRDKTYLTYVMNPVHDWFVVERTPGRVWLRFAPS